jgi:hypothetical protein
MTLLPQVRDQLTAAARRRARRRRVRAPGWPGASPRPWRRAAAALTLAVALGSAALVVVVVLATVRTETPKPRASGSGHTISPFGSPPTQPNLSTAAAREITRAAQRIVAHDRACSPAARPLFPPGHAPASLTSRLAVLRRPASAADRLPSLMRAAAPRASLRNLYVADSRLAQVVGTTRFFVIPTANAPGLRPVPARCEQEQRSALVAALAHVSPSTRRRLLAQQRRYLAWRRDEQLHPEGVTLAIVTAHPAPGTAMTWTGLAGGFTFGDVEAGVAGLGEERTDTGTVFHQLVPDGVARVALRLSGRGTVTVPVVDNLLVVRLPPAGGAVPSSIRWLSRSGRVISPAS